MWLTSEGIEPSNRHHPISSHCVGWRGFRLPFQGVQNPWDGTTALLLTAQVPGGPNLLWRSPPLPGQTYPMSEWSWRLSVFSWWSCYVRRWQDGFQYLSAHCQVRVGACGYVLSCLALNGVASRGSSSSVAYPVLKKPSVMAGGGLGVCRAELRGGATAGWQMVKSFPLVAIEMGERTGTDWARV
jgi:hypothetical protein